MEDGRLYKQKRYDDIVEEQVLIAYLTKSISFTDVDYMTPYDRGLVLKCIREIKKEENKSYENMT